ncbi:MAG TPA: ABC transporter substrate-binding protein [Methylomirabilota bacterium]|nr:ABC transporter substrate-binding protein [Methylomirabilota bacterium]
MRYAVLVVIAALLACTAPAQDSHPCSCGSNPPGRPAPRSLKPYTGAPDDLRPYSKFTVPYYEYYNDLIEYNGAARDIPDPDLKDLNEIRIGFIGPLFNHPDQELGNRMLHGAQLAVDEANAAGGYCGKPFRLMLHNDSAVWGASSNEVVKMVYDEKVWAMFGSISSDTTHIALRVSLKAETPIVNSASTDPTIPETTIPWFFTDIQDDRLQGYTLARHIYTVLGLQRIAILRVNDRYGRFGVLKFRDASRRLGHPVVIEQKFMPGDTDFRRQLRIIQDSRADGIVLWTDIRPTALILQQMKELGMKQRVFGSHRTIGDELVSLAGPAAEGFEAVYPYDPTQRSQSWLDFVARFDARYHEKPDHFAALAYDAMRILLQSICRAGLNRARIRDALTAIQSYDGVTGKMVFDPNCKNISALFLATVRNGAIEYRRITMDKPYARVGEDGVTYSGPATPDIASPAWKIAVFGPRADQAVNSPEITQLLSNLDRSGHHYSLIAIPTEISWGKAATALVQAVYQDQALGIIALDRDSSHLAEQIGVKAFVPVLCISSDKMLTSANVPWVFRLPEGSPLSEAVNIFTQAAQVSGANRGKIRESLASGESLNGARFDSTGEMR